MTDARDLAAWLVDNTRRGIPGVVNVPGRGGHHVRGAADGLRPGHRGGPGAGQRGAGQDGPLQLRWVPDQVLLAAGVQPWTELPMWAPETPEFAALWNVTGDRALRTGLRYRPLSDTVRDTWGWLRRDAAARGGERPSSSGPEMGLDPAKEQEILAGLD